MTKADAFDYLRNQTAVLSQNNIWMRMKWFTYKHPKDYLLLLCDKTLVQMFHLEKITGPF